MTLTPEERERARASVKLAARKISSGEWTLEPGVWRKAELELKASRGVAVKGGLKGVAKLLHRALEVPGVPPEALSLLQEALTALEAAAGGAGVRPEARAASKSVDRPAVKALDPAEAQVEGQANAIVRRVLDRLAAGRFMKDVDRAARISRGQEDPPLDPGMATLKDEVRRARSKRWGD